MLASLDEQPVLNHIEELVAEEHSLWQAESEGRLDDAGYERLRAIRRGLDHPYETLRRRRAGQPDEGPADRDVPEPPNELDGPDPEPQHTEHGVQEQDSLGSDPAPKAPWVPAGPPRRPDRLPAERPGSATSRPFATS